MGSEIMKKHAQSTYLDEHLWCKQNPVQKIHLTAKIEANPSAILEPILGGGGGPRRPPAPPPLPWLDVGVVTRFVAGYLNEDDTPCFETNPSPGGPNPRWKAKVSFAVDWSPKEDTAPVLKLDLLTATFLSKRSSLASRLLHLAPYIMYPEQVCETWLPLDSEHNERKEGEVHLGIQFIPDARGRLAEGNGVAPFAPSLVREVRDPVHAGSLAVKVMAVRGVESQELFGKEVRAGGSGRRRASACVCVDPNGASMTCCLNPTGPLREGDPA